MFTFNGVRHSGRSSRVSANHCGNIFFSLIFCKILTFYCNIQVLCNSRGHGRTGIGFQNQAALVENELELLSIHNICSYLGAASVSTYVRTSEKSNTLSHPPIYSRKPIVVKMLTAVWTLNLQQWRPKERDWSQIWYLFFFFACFDALAAEAFQDDGVMLYLQKHRNKIVVAVKTCHELSSASAWYP